MTEKEFEIYWKENRESILSSSEEYRLAQENFKLKSGADWLLFGIPIVAGIVFMNNCNLGNELLGWLVSAIVTIACFAVCVWIKGLITGKGSPDEVEETIRNREKVKMVE